MEGEDNVFEIERILDSSVGKGIRYYRVRWKGFGAEEDTWEPEENLFDCKNVLDQYWKKAAKVKKARAKKRKSETASKFETGKAKKKKGGRTTNNSTIARIDSSSSLDGQIILPGEEKRSSDVKNSKRKHKHGSDKEIQPKKKHSDVRQSSSNSKESTKKKKKRKKDIDKTSLHKNVAEQSHEAKQMLDENENKRDTVQVYDITVEDKAVDDKTVGESTSSKHDLNLQRENSSESVGNKRLERRSWSSYEASPEYVPEYCDETLAYDICDEEDYEFFGDTGYFVKDSVGYEQGNYFARRESLDVDKGTKDDRDNGKENENHVNDDEDHVDDDEDHVDDDEDHVDDDGDHVDDDEDHLDDDEDHDDDDDDEDHVDDDDNEDNDDGNDDQVGDDKDHISDREDRVNDDEYNANDDKDHENDNEHHANDDKDHANDDQDHVNDDKVYANDDEDTANNNKNHVNVDKNHVNVDKDHVTVDKDHMNDKHHVNDDDDDIKGIDNDVKDLEGDVEDDGRQLKKLDCLADDERKIGSTSSLGEIANDTQIETSKEDSKVHSSSLDVTTSMSEAEHHLSSTTSRSTNIEENQELKEGASSKTSDGLQHNKESLDKVVHYDTEPGLSAKINQGNNLVRRDDSMSDVVNKSVSGDKVRTQRNIELTLKVRSSSSGESTGMTDECISPEFAKLPTPVKGYFDRVFAERTDNKDTTEALTQGKEDKEIEVIKDDDENESDNRGKQEKCEDDSCLDLKKQIHEKETDNCKTISNVVANPDVTPAEKLVEIISIDDAIDESIDNNRVYESAKDQPPIMVAKQANASESDISNTVCIFEIEGTCNKSNRYGTKDILSDTSPSKSETVLNVVDLKEQTHSKTGSNPVEKERKLSEEETAHCLLDLSSVRLGKSSKTEMIETNLQPSKDSTDDLVENSIIPNVILKKFDKLESGKKLNDTKPPHDTTKIENIEQNRQQFSVKRKSYESNSEKSGKKCRLPLNLPFVEENCKEVLDILDHAAKPAQVRETEHSVNQTIVHGSQKTLQAVSHVEQTATSNSSSITQIRTTTVTSEQKSTTTASQSHSGLIHKTTGKHETLIMPEIRLSSLNISKKKPESIVVEKTNDNNEKKHMPDIVFVSDVPKLNLVTSQHDLTSPILSLVSSENVLQSQQLVSTSIPLRHSSPSGSSVGGVKITQVYGKGKYEGPKQGVDPVSWSGDATKTYPYSTQFSPAGSLHINPNLYSDTPSANAFIVGHLNQSFSVSPNSFTSQFSQQQFPTQPNTHTNQKPFSAVAGINWYPDNKGQRGLRQLMFLPSTNLLPKPLYYVPEFPTSPQPSKQPLHNHVYARALQEMAKRRQVNSSGQSASSDFINKDYSLLFNADRTLYAKRAGSASTMNSSQTIQTEIQGGKTNVHPSIGTDLEARRLSNNIEVTIADSSKKDDLISVSKAEKRETKLPPRISETEEGDLMVSSPSVSLGSKDDTQLFARNKNSDHKTSDKSDLVCDLGKSKDNKTMSNVPESQTDNKLEILEKIDSESSSTIAQSKDNTPKVKDKNTNKDKSTGISNDVATSNSDSNKKSKSSFVSDSKSSGNGSRTGSKEWGRDLGSSQDHKEKRSDSEKSRGKDKEISRRKEDSSKTSRSRESDRESKRDSKGKEIKRQESVDLEFEFDFDEYSPGEVVTEKSEKMDISQSGIPAAMSLRQVKSAIKQGDSATVLASLAGGMNIDSQDSVTGMTLLMRAVTFGQENIVKLLLNHGANINIKDNTGSTPLISACEQGFENIVSLLLNVEIDINAKQTASGETALIKACMKGHHSVVSMLLAHGADCQMRSVSGLTAAQLAVQCGQFEIRDLLESHSKKLQRCVETTIASCLCDSSKLMYPPLLPFVSLYPAEGQEFTYHFHCSNLLLSKTILLFCLRAIFSRSGQVDLSFSKDNGLHTVLLNGSLQSPVLSNNKSVFVLQPKLDTNRLILQTYQSHVHLLVCIYAAELDENSVNMVSSSIAT